MRKITKVGTYILHIKKNAVYEVIKIIKYTSDEFYFKIKPIESKYTLNFLCADKYVDKIVNREEHPEYFL